MAAAKSARARGRRSSAAANASAAAAPAASTARKPNARKSKQPRGVAKLGATSKEMQADWLLDRQIDLPLYGIASLLVMHALSGTSSLSLAHLTTHLPHSLQVLIPAWARHLPSLAPFASDVPNASHNSKLRGGAAGLNSIWEATTGAAGPFRSDAAGFGHPLSALHSFTRACLGLSYAVPDARTSPVSAAAHAAGLPVPQSHRSANSEPWAWLVGGPGVMYDKGIKDALFVLTGILVFTTLRAATIKHVLAPLGELVTSPPDAPASAGSGARAVQKRKEKAARQKRATVQRFAEQGWNVIYYSASLSFGLYLAYNSSYWLNTKGIWEDWPVRQLDRSTKFYYLAQCAFWFQQLIVLNVEARRKDHLQMFSHHIITILLMLGSYCSHFTRVGNAVLVLMDPSDIMLSGAKCLRYMGFTTGCDVAFGLFMLSWIITRQVLYPLLIWSCIQPVHRMQPGMLPSLDFDPPLLGFRDPVRGSLVYLLIALQGILLVWFGMIVRVAWRVVSGSGAEDTRSDAEDEEEEEDSEQEKRAVGSAIQEAPASRPSLPPSDAARPRIPEASSSARPSSSQGRRRAR